jgi:hypothetical protein
MAELTVYIYLQYIYIYIYIYIIGEKSSRPSMSVSPVNVYPRTNGQSRDITERQEGHPALIHTASKPNDRTIKECGKRR